MKREKHKGRDLRAYSAHLFVKMFDYIFLFFWPVGMEESSVYPHPSDVIRRRQSSLDHKERDPAALLEKQYKVEGLFF